MDKYARVCASVDLNAILNNYEIIKNNIKSETKIMGVIKADGYGHGAIPIAKELEKIDYVFGYAVATAEEAFILKKSNLRKPILILGYTFPYAYKELIENEIRFTAFREDMLEELNAVAKELGKKAFVHIKVDTAMSRIGIFPDESGIKFIKKALQYENLVVEGIFTHFAKADDKEVTDAVNQLTCYKDFLDTLEKENIHIPIKHCANSAAAMQIRDASMDMVRLGISQYGLWPSDEMCHEMKLEPALTLVSHIVYVKTIKKGTSVSYGRTFIAEHDMKVATIPVGYGDGYPRSLSNKGEVLIGGKRAPILGRVCMDQFMVDVTNIENCQMGDEVILIGKMGNAEITMEELGEKSHRFNYELACDLGKRIPRVYVKDGSVIGTKDYYDDY